MSISKSKKLRIFRLFAAGKSPEQISETLNDPAEATGRNSITPSIVEKLFREYFSLPLNEQLRLTLMPERVANRRHRLADDLSDLGRIDALLGECDEKMLVSLLDLKRKIKERMAKEDQQSAESQEEPQHNETDQELRCLYDEHHDGDS